MKTNNLNSDQLCEDKSENGSNMNKNEMKDLSYPNQPQVLSNPVSLSRETMIMEISKNPEVLTKLADFHEQPILVQINIVITTLFQMNEEKASAKDFLNLLKLAFDHFLKHFKDNNYIYYKKFLTEILPIVDEYYIELINDKDIQNEEFSFINQMIEEIKFLDENVFASFQNLPIDAQSKEDAFKSSISTLKSRIESELKKMDNSKEITHSFTSQYLKELLESFKKLESQNISQGLIDRKFDKKKFNLTHTIIIGADAGLYALLNTLTEEEILKFSQNDGLRAVLTTSDKGNGKIVIGEGSFGKIRIALALLANESEGNTLLAGSVICVKKAGSKKKQKTRQAIWSSTWNDYCSINFLEGDAPEIYDMIITKDCREKEQGYCFQKLFLFPNGSLFEKNQNNKMDKYNSEFQEYYSWLHVKKYLIGICELMIKLHQKGYCMTDLKPANTLYDKKSMTTKLVDLAGAVRNENLTSCMVKHVTEFTPKYASPELFDPYDDIERDNLVDLTKCISWTVGKITEGIFDQALDSQNDEEIVKKIKILCSGLTEIDVCKRWTLNEARDYLKNIHDLEKLKIYNYEDYVHLLKAGFQNKNENIQKALRLKNDIFSLYECFNERLMISASDPDNNEYDFAKDPSKNDLLPEINRIFSRENNREAIFLFGSAGSGKSTILQKMFIDAIYAWKNGDPIPIYINLALEQRLDFFWISLMDSLSIRNLPFECILKTPLKLFLDSLDESRTNGVRAIANIFVELSNYDNLNAIKAIITCRSGYIEESKIHQEINKTIMVSLKYIIPLNRFFFDEKQNNLQGLIELYLRKIEFKSEKEEILIADKTIEYLRFIKEHQLHEMMKTTYMIFIILSILPELMKKKREDKCIGKIILLDIFKMYMENNLTKEIERSENKIVKNKNVGWFIKLGESLAESMMETHKATNLLANEEVLEFLHSSLFRDIEEEYNAKLPLADNVHIFNVLRTLNLTIITEKEKNSLNFKEKISLSFSHDTIKNFLITSSFIKRIEADSTFPKWISNKIITEDYNLVRFLVEAFRYNEKIREISEIAILETRKVDDVQSAIRAANLITILVASNHSFFGKDLSHIKIRGANISDGIFTNCNFDYADLSEVTLNNVKFDGASFDNTNLENIKLDMFAPFVGHSDSVNSISFSPDGKKVISGSNDQTLKLWDCETGEELMNFKGHSDSVYCVAFSRDGKQVVSGSVDQTLRIWDVETGTELKILEGHSNEIYSLSFSPDGKKLVSGGYDKTLIFWDVEKGTILKMNDLYCIIRSVSFSPDGKRVLSASNDNSLQIWDAETGEQIIEFDLPDSSIQSATFSPDGKKFAIGTFKTLKIRDANTGEELKKFEGHFGPVRSVAFSPDGKKLVSGSRDTTLRIWDVETGVELKKLEGHSGELNCVSFSPDGKKVASGSDDENLRIWDASIRSELKIYEGHSDSIYSVSFSPDGKKTVSGSKDKTFKVWDVKTGAELRKFEGHSDYVRSVSFSHDGKKLISGSNDQTLKLWDVETGEELKKFEGHSHYVQSVSFSANGKKLASCGSDKTLRIWDAETGAELKKIEQPGSVMSVSFSPDSIYVVSGCSDKIVRIWNSDTGEEFKKFEGHSGSVFFVSFSPDGKKVISGSMDRTMKIWNVETGKELQILEGHCDSILSAAFSPDGKKVVSGSRDNTLRIWDAETGNELSKYEGFFDFVVSVSYAPDGKSVIGGNVGKTLRLLNVDTQRNKTQIKSDTDNDSNQSQNIEFKNKSIDVSLIISPSATAFSCRNCLNYRSSISCPPQLQRWFRQMDEIYLK